MKWTGRMRATGDQAGYEARKDAQRERLAEDLRRQLTGKADVMLELGCGHGHFLSQYAAAHPATFCVGVDLKPSRIRKATDKADRADAPNTTFVWADARDVLACWPEGVGLRHVFVLFPDPWPKARHAKNRMLQVALLQQLAAVTVPEARLCFRTDDFNNMAWVRAQVGQGSGWQEDNRTPWPFEIETVFQGYANRYQSLILAKG